MLPLLDERPDGLDGTVEDRADVDDFLAKLNFPSADAGDVEQVVNEPGELFDLPLDDLRGPLERLVKFGLSCDEHGVADGGERVSELVGEHREELVLAAVRLAQQPPPLVSAR